MEPWEIMISESQERMVAVVRPELPRPRRGRAATAGSSRARAIGEVTDTGELRVLLRRRDSSARSRPRCSPTSARATRCAAARSRRPRRAVADGRDDGAAPAPARRTSQPRLDLRAVRPPRRLAHGAPPGPRRRGACACGRRCAGSPSRSTGRRSARSTRDRRRGGRPRGGAQRRLRRRRAARAHRLPQLRQPGEAGDRLGARRGDRGDRAGVRGARRARRLRQRLALQRDRRAADPPDAGRRLRRARAGRARVVPGRWRDGRRVFLAGSPLARRLRVPGALRRGRRPTARSTSRRGCADRVLWRTAPLLSLAHDVARRRPRRLLAEAALAAGSAPSSSCRRPSAVRRGRRPGGGRLRADEARVARASRSRGSERSAELRCKAPCGCAREAWET